MKYHELKAYIAPTADGKGLADYYLKSDVDAAIDELKAEINRKEGVGQRWFERCMEARTENIRLKRALWLARAEWARSSALSYHLIESHPDKDAAATYKRKANKWEKVKDKCRSKAERYGEGK